MKFHKGDKVRFLNETGSGTVVKIIGNGMVVVEVEDGFEYPYPEKQLVPEEPDNEKEAAGKKALSVKPRAVENEMVEEDFEAYETSVNNRYADGIYLAFIPKHQQFPSAGEIELVLLNHSEYDIYFTISLKDGRDWICIHSGALRPRGQEKIDKLTPQQIDEWGTVKTDILFFSGDAYAHRNPVSDQLRLKGVKFFKDATYTEDMLTGKRAYLAEIEMLEENAPAESERPFINNEDIKRMLEAKERNSFSEKRSVPHLKNQQLDKEVDLHIEELMDNWAGLTNAQLIDVQLRHMQKELDEAIGNHYQRITFIHGVGNGRLKSEVRRVLAGYKGIRFHDGSYQRYGFGATEVLLH